MSACGARAAAPVASAGPEGDPSQPHGQVQSSVSPRGAVAPLVAFTRELSYGRRAGTTLDSTPFGECLVVMVLLRPLVTGLNWSSVVQRVPAYKAGSLGQLAMLRTRTLLSHAPHCRCDTGKHASATVAQPGGLTLDAVPMLLGSGHERPQHSRGEHE